MYIPDGHGQDESYCRSLSSIFFFEPYFRGIAVYTKATVNAHGPLVLVDFTCKIYVKGNKTDR